MLRPRIIPCLLLQQGGLVKTQGFRDPKYVGDPINAVRIFNEKEADELLFLDIDATAEKREPNFDLIAKLAAECRMPLCYGGGIKTAAQAQRIVNMGVEKVAMSAAAVENPSLLSEMAAAVGRQSVVAVLDVRKKRGIFAKNYEICTHSAKRVHKQDPLTLAKQLQDAGAGEIMINAIDQDGFMQGYDMDLATKFKKKLNIPLTFLGGAGSLEHIEQLISKMEIVGAAAGSLFTFKGKYRAVLINYPTPTQKTQLCHNALKIKNS